MRNVFLLVLFLGFGINATAQKYAFVDSDFILSKIPDYAQAQKQLNQMSEQWQGEIESLFSEANALERALNAEKILLTDEMISKREEDIKKKRAEARGLQQQYFGPEGELFKKRQELIKPIQDQVYNAVQSVAKKRKYDIVFDKSSGLIMLYTNPRADISDEVLDNLGY